MSLTPRPLPFRETDPASTMGKAKKEIQTDDDDAIFAQRAIELKGASLPGPLGTILGLSARRPPERERRLLDPPDFPSSPPPRASLPPFPPLEPSADPVSSLA